MSIAIFNANMHNWRKSPLVAKNDKRFSEDHMYARIAVHSMIKAWIYGLCPPCSLGLILIDVSSRKDHDVTRHFIPGSVHDIFK